MQKKITETAESMCISPIWVSDFFLLLLLLVLGTCQAHIGAVTNLTNEEVKVPWLHKPQLAMSAIAHGRYKGLQR